MIIALIICITILLIAILILNYDYKNPYVEEIISSIDKTRRAKYTDGSKSSTDHTLVTIKRTYKNGNV